MHTDPVACKYNTLTRAYIISESGNIGYRVKSRQGKDPDGNYRPLLKEGSAIVSMEELTHNT